MELLHDSGLHVVGKCRSINRKVRKFYVRNAQLRSESAKFNFRFSVKLWKLQFYCELVLYFVGHYGPRVASKTFKSFNSTIIDLSLRDNQDVNVKTIIMG